MEGNIKIIIFNLILNINFTNSNCLINYRHLVIGGRKGHVMSIDWMENKIKSEIHLKETVRDVKSVTLLLSHIYNSFP